MTRAEQQNIRLDRLPSKGRSQSNAIHLAESAGNDIRKNAGFTCRRKSLLQPQCHPAVVQQDLDYLPLATRTGAFQGYRKHHRMPSNIYFGAEESGQQRRGVRLSATSYEHKAVIPAHQHANAYFCINTSGGFVERSGRSEREVHVHDLVYHPPGHRHSDRFSESGGRCLNLEMDPAWLARLPRAVSATTPIYISDPDMRRIGRALIHEFLQPESNTSLAVDSLLLELLSRFRGPSRRRNGRPPPWLLGVRDRLRSNFTEGHTLTALADTAGVHPVHLAREFRRQFGCPIHVYLRRCRIEAAANLLEDSDRPLTEIAFDPGFCGQSHFSRVFGALKGVAPGMYRRQARDRRR